MDEGHRADAQDEASRAGESGVAVYVRGGGVQPRADAEADGDLSWCRMSPGRSVPGLGRNRQLGPQIQPLTVLLRGTVRLPHQFGKNEVAESARNCRFSAAC